MEMINRLIMNFPDAPREYLNYCKAQGLYGSDWYNDEDRDIKLAPWKGYVHTSTEEEVLNNFGHFPCEWVEEVFLYPLKETRSPAFSHLWSRLVLS